MNSSNLTNKSDSKNLPILNIVVTGTIGVGKSTVINYLRQLLSDLSYIHCSVVNEYIVEKYNSIPVGEIMLNMFMQNKLSSFTFQNYIIDWWDKQYKWLDSQSYVIANSNQNKYKLWVKIFERLPYDNINCFAKYAVLSNNLSQREFDALNNRYQSVLGQYQPIDYSNSYNVTRVNDDSRITAEAIKSDVMYYLGHINSSSFNSITTRTYNLLSSNYTNLVRANIDSRQRESDNLYTNDDLGYIVNYYNNLF